MMESTRMGWAYRLRRVAKRQPLVLLLLLLSLVALLSGCGGPTSSVFTRAAPLSTDVVITYNLLQSGVVGLRARDGAPAWRAATGKGNPHWAPLVVGGVLYIEGGTQQSPMGTLAAVRL